ncbi:Asp-tRNA(Asn)/Glu-tRNA(Gln) amidotransferase subunit GatA [Candidatus Microgenomates bacterium]|jgi:aspartyl-tRNA(Asn)/glutamyl-tRNA(Gln) amidotransferase subunit A|nr:MAG: Asp-tRNA(Asn)/Glu-tRNA(Gln) amidotransferase subunit GatA [Candidatus Microgenomates bacterium]
MDSLYQLSILEAKEGIKKGSFSREELVKSVLSRIEEVEPKLNSFVSVNKEAVKDARKKDQEKEDKALSGIPVAIKEVLSTIDIKTTASSRVLENYYPAYDATVVAKLKENGAILIGKTNCDAFAFGASTENSGFGVSKNPYDLERVPGGSSGGSASAVAAGETIFALGTDTGGSIRQPASFCSITGLKPTYGACSRYGLLAMASSLDCPGPMTKTAEDAETVFNLIKGKDPKDATSVDFPEKKLQTGKIRIGLPKEYFSDGIDKEVKEAVLKAVKSFPEKDFEFTYVSLPNTGYAIEVYYIITPSEISSNMARYDGIRFGKERKYFEDEVKRRIMLGTYTLSAGYIDQFYLKASKVRRLITNDLENAFKKVDLIIGPVSPTPPFKIGEKTDDPLKMYLGDILTASANLAGIPGISVPCGFADKGLPIGMQIMGPRFSEELIFFVSKTFQTLTNWHKARPKI